MDSTAVHGLKDIHVPSSWQVMRRIVLGCHLLRANGEQFLKEHLFGDIFGRDNLDSQIREVATISALASMEGVNPQLQAHFNIGFNIGLTEAQMKSLVSMLGAKVGKKEADNASDVLSRVLNGRTR
jgi:4-carboxymuconolactone decarboxylase